MQEERFTEYHCGVAVLRDKTEISAALQKLAKYEDLESTAGFCLEDLVNLHTRMALGGKHDE